MKTSPIFLSDLLLFRDLFTPNQQLAIVDPTSRLKDYSQSTYTSFSDDMDPNWKGLVADLTPNIENAITIGIVPINNTIAFHYINNPDGTIRWMYPSNYNTPSFLSLYNSGTIKSKLFNVLSHLACFTGKQHWLNSGVINIQTTFIENFIAECNITSNENFCLFTGTRGATRKIVVAISNQKNTTDFIKIPVSSTSTNLIQNEITMLNVLNKYDFTTLSLPVVATKISGHARISNIKPSLTIPLDKINTIHVKALAEMYAISHDRKSVSDSIAWSVIKENMDWLKRELVFCNSISIKKTEKIIRLLRKLYNTIRVGESVPLSVSHGDFTPWNMFCDEQRLYVYDWEMARNGIPMLFDMFHYTYQSSVLQKRLNYPAIHESIESWKKLSMTKQLIAKYKINTDLHEQLYLLFTVSHYVRQYINEKELLIQSEWMIDAWTEALESQLKVVDKSL